MGRAMRWLKKLLSGKKEGHKDPKVNHATSAGEGVDAGEKKRWSFVKQRNSGVEGCKMPLAAAVDAAELSLVRPCGCGQDGDVRWRAGRREAEAAVVIQKSFRGYLARKALRALKSLVKLQALVRGYLVRKQAATTLHRLQALMRLQAASYGIKKASSWRSMEQERIMARESRIKPRALQGHRRRLSDSTDSNLERSPRIVEIDTCQLRSRSSRMTGQYAPEFSDGLPALAPWSSPLLYKSSSRLSNRRCQDRAAPRQSKTAQSTPRFAAPPGFPSYDSPAKSVGAVDGLMRRSPHYMAETASSVAKARCQSAPRLRHAALAGPRKSCSQVQHSSGFKSSEVYSSVFSDEPTRDYYLDSMW